MEETIKYFDYKLAYDGYKRVEELFNIGGLKAVLMCDEFSVNKDYGVEDLKENGFIPINAFGYNATIYIFDRNFDTDNEEIDLYVSGDIDIYSYSGGDDTLCINDIDSIKNRMQYLVRYAEDNEYTQDDIYMEYNSLLEVLRELKEEK